MDKKLVAVAVAIGMAGASSAFAGTNYILHFQGRNWSSWQSNRANTSGATLYESRSGSSGWTDVTFNFDGNVRLANTSVDNAINSWIRSYCGSATANTCILHCYSAGCNRVKKAIDDIRNGANGGGPDGLAGVLWMHGSGDASGGTDLAELSTSGFTGFLAKILGQQAAIDKDLTRSAARSTYWWIHDQVGVNFWHLAGYLDTCKGLLFVKVCGGSHISGTSDGVVPWASSGGYSSSAARYSMCSVSASDEQTNPQVSGKYPWHRTDTYMEYCSGNNSQTSWDHAAIVNYTEAVLESTVHSGGQSYYYYDTFTDPSPPSTACSGSNCDTAMQAYAQNVTQGYNSSGQGQNNGATLASTGSPANGTTGLTNSCNGRCGSNPGGSYCRCDQASGACADYYTAHCDSVNQ
jgi:hypothetical protein